MRKHYNNCKSSIGIGRISHCLICIKGLTPHWHKTWHMLAQRKNDEASMLALELWLYFHFFESHVWSRQHGKASWLYKYFSTLVRKPCHGLILPVLFILAHLAISHWAQWLTFAGQSHFSARTSFCQGEGWHSYRYQTIRGVWQGSHWGCFQCSLVSAYWRYGSNTSTCFPISSPKPWSLCINQYPLDGP